MCTRTLGVLRHSPLWTGKSSIQQRGPAEAQGQLDHNPEGGAGGKSQDLLGDRAAELSRNGASVAQLEAGGKQDGDRGQGEHRGLFSGPRGRS